MYGRNRNRENDPRHQRQSQQDSFDLRYDQRFGAYDPNMGMHDYADYTGDGDRYSQNRDSTVRRYPGHPTSNSNESNFFGYRGGAPSLSQWREADPYRQSSPSYGQPEWTPSPSESRRGLFYGKGPKGYRRSDERIREDVCERLADHGDIDATEMDVSVSEGIVTLSGSVNSRRTKRLAEEAIESVSGVQDIRNEVRVISNENFSS